MPHDTETPTPQDLRDSVRDFRHASTSTLERKSILDWWGSIGVPNQFAAMLRAAEIERAGDSTS